MPPIAGVRLATAEAGIRYKNRTDVLLALLDKGTAVAGVFTKSKCPSAPVEWCRAKLKGGKARALVVNSGNANAFTGKTGRQSDRLTAQIAAKAVGCSAERHLPRLDRRDRRAARRDQVRRRARHGSPAAATPGDWLDAAKAIMTTDTFPKVATATAKLGKATVTINGMAKGAGMIAPDMATMLSFVFTDAPIAPAALQALLKSGVEDTFNAVTIDGDTSTSDTLLAFATGAAADARRAEDQPRQRSAAEGLPQGASTRCSPISPSRSRATAKARASSSRSSSRARRPRRSARKIAHVDRQLAAGEDRDRRRGRQLGPRRHGGRQGRRAGRPRQALDLVQRHPRRAQAARAIRPTTRRRSRRR